MLYILLGLTILVKTGAQVSLNLLCSLSMFRLPVPTVPAVDGTLFQAVVLDALAIAVVSVTINISLGRLFAREGGYQIEANQELFAIGASNLFGAFFGCFPVGASVPRSSLQVQAGGRTQVRTPVRFPPVNSNYTQFPLRIRVQDLKF